MTRLVAHTLTLGLLLVGPANAQEPPAPETAGKAAARAEARTSLTSLRVQITIARYDGERKVSSLPVAFTVNAGEIARTTLRMGIELPIKVAVAPDKDGKPGSASVQYRNVGTNIDCRAGAVGPDGRYPVEVRAEQSSVPG